MALVPDVVAAHARAEFHRALVDQPHRRGLSAKMKGDPVIREQARRELARLEEGKPHGLLDRDWVSRQVYQLLTDMLAELGTDPTPPMTIQETK